MSRVKFKGFEFNLKTKELSQNNKLISLQPKQADVLSLLIEHSGNIISREELKQQFWSDTIVEFDQSINFCIKSIRKALNDDPKNPQFIQTVPRRGYQFIAAIEAVKTSIDNSAAPQSIKSPAQRRKPKLYYPLAAGVGLAVTVIFLFSANTSEPTPPHLDTEITYTSKLDLDFKRALYLFEKGDAEYYSRSYDMFAKIVSEYPNYPDAHAYYALSGLFTGVDDIHRIMKEHTELAQYYHPNSSMTLVLEGMTELYINWNAKAAHQLFQKAVAQSPDLTIGWHELAVTSVLLEDLELGTRSIEKAIQLAPGKVQERYHTGWFYMVTGDYERALMQCEQTIELSPKHAYAHQCAAQSALAMGLDETAKKYFLSYMHQVGASPESITRVSAALDNEDYLAFYEWLYQGLNYIQAPDFLLASAKAHLKDYDAANKHLLQAINNRETHVPLVLAYPEFQALRTDPKFKGTLDAINY